MTDYAARKVAEQIDALHGDAPLGAVLEVLTLSAPIPVRASVKRFQQRHRACIEGDDVALLRRSDDHDDRPPLAVAT